MAGAFVAYEVMRLRDLIWAADQALREHRDLSITREEESSYEK